MKFNNYIFIIAFLFIIEIYKTNSRPYSSWESSSSWSSHTSEDGTVSLTTNEHSSSQVDGKTVSEVNKSDTTVTKPDGSISHNSSNNNSKPKSPSQPKPAPQPQPQPQPQPKPQPKPTTKKTIRATTQSRPKTSAKSAPSSVPIPPSPPLVPNPPVVDTPTTTTTAVSVPSTDVIIDETITNVCAEQCLQIFSKCRYFGTLSNLNDVSLNAIYPPPTGSFGDCLCKSDQNHVGFYYECAKCLQTNSNNSNSSITDQNVKSSCQALGSNTATDYNSRVIKMDNSAQNIEEPKKGGFNKTNLIIICSVVGVGLFAFGGYKLNRYIQDKRRESLPMY